MTAYDTEDLEMDNAADDEHAEAVDYTMEEEAEEILSAEFIVAPSHLEEIYQEEFREPPVSSRVSARRSGRSSAQSGRANTKVNKKAKMIFWAINLALLVAMLVAGSYVVHMNVDGGIPPWNMIPWSSFTSSGSNSSSDLNEPAPEYGLEPSGNYDNDIASIRTIFAEAEKLRKEADDLEGKDKVERLDAAVTKLSGGLMLIGKLEDRLKAAGETKSETGKIIAKLSSDYGAKKSYWRNALKAADNE